MKIPQLSRVPNSIRDVDILDDEGEVVGTKQVKQTLVFIKERVSLLEMTEWLEKNDVKIEKPKPKEPSNWTPNANDAVEDVEKWKAAYNMYKKKYGEWEAGAVSGNWMNGVNIGTLCYKVDLSLSSSCGIASQKLSSTFKSKDKQVSIEEPITAGWTWAEKNNVDKIKLNTKEEYKKIRRAASLKQLIINENKLQNNDK